MQIELKRLQREYGITTVLVTHDQEEALALADRIAVMNRGCVEQVATPTDIYDRPATLFVNRFVGTTNVLAGVVVTDSAVRLADGTTLRAPTSSLGPVPRVVVSIRPEHLRLEPRAAAGAIPVVIKVIMPLGPAVIYEVETTDGAALKVSMPRAGGTGLLEPGAWMFASAATPAAFRVFADPSAALDSTRIPTDGGGAG